MEQFLKNILERQELTDIILCDIDKNKKQQPSYVDDIRSAVSNALPLNSTTEALFSLGATIYFIDCDLK